MLLSCNYSLAEFAFAAPEVTRPRWFAIPSADPPVRTLLSEEYRPGLRDAVLDELEAAGDEFVPAAVGICCARALFGNIKQAITISVRVETLTTAPRFMEGLLPAGRN